MIQLLKFLIAVACLCQFNVPHVHGASVEISNLEPRRDVNGNIVNVPFLSESL